ncbi:MAG TPA: hypothetical protein DEB09_03575 [Candidatus Magasanikbacteria bacterium]|nr:hypothetical protein [Candidatus Magasanikbacteria bacterium]
MPKVFALKSVQTDELRRYPPEALDECIPSEKTGGRRTPSEIFGVVPGQWMTWSEYRVIKEAFPSRRKKE